jgi:hypothetical protein
MATIIEHIDGPNSTFGDSPGVEMVYKIFNVATESSARALLLAEAPLTYGGLMRFSGTLKSTGVDSWEGTVLYKLGVRNTENDPLTENADYAPAGTDPIPPQFSFDISPGTQHITQSLQTMDSVSTPGNVPMNFDRAIRVSETGVEGVDIDSTEFSWTEVWTFPIEVITWEYIRRLVQLRGSVNQGQFRTFEQGEVRFIGASGQPTGDNQFQITYSFKASRNQTNVTVSDDLDPFAFKGGWEYIWCAYSKQVDENRLIQRPIAAYLERLFPYENLEQLGIGS